MFLKNKANDKNYLPAHVIMCLSPHVPRANWKLFRLWATLFCPLGCIDIRSTASLRRHKAALGQNNEA